MKIVIIEDEHLSADRLERMIKKYDPGIEVVAKLESVKQAIQFFADNPEPDLIFLDIHLEDNLSFAIFEHIKINAPVIFTTAYDEYAIQAFKLKSIDYLLKPIIQQELNAALEKYKEWNHPTGVDITSLYQSIQNQPPRFKERLSVQIGNKLKTIQVKEIAYFYSEENINFLMLYDKSSYPVDQSLDQLMNQLDPHDFFRINRQYIISLNAIRNVTVYPKRRLKIDLQPNADKEIFVSMDRIANFKDWLNS